MKTLKILCLITLMCMVYGNAMAQEVNAQELEQEETIGGKELGKTADGRWIQMWDLNISEDTGDVSYIISFDKAKAGELWSWCRMWLAENVQEYNHIKLIEDKQEGRLVVNFTAPVKVRHNDGKWDSRWLGQQTWKMTIQCKDERFRVRMTEYTSEWDAQFMQRGSWSPALEQINKSTKEAAKRMGEGVFDTQYKEVISYIIASQGEYMKKMSEEDDDF